MTKQTLGMMIASLRKERGMTQAELAERVGVTDKAVSKWERDLSCPDINTIPKLAEIFGISVEKLMGMENEYKERKPNHTVGYIVDMVLTGVGVAMGIAVVVLGVLCEIDADTACIMLGIGLACMAIERLRDKSISV